MFKIYKNILCAKPVTCSVIAMHSTYTYIILKILFDSIFCNIAVPAVITGFYECTFINTCLFSLY